MKTDSSQNFAALLKRLPPPDARYASEGIAFEVYRAKDRHDVCWKSQALKEIVRMCRMSYGRYGNRPSFDAYDAKAVVYLIRVSYKVEKVGSVEEWFNLRMVPGDKEPIGVFEPEIYEKDGVSVDMLMKRKIGASKFWNQVASSSRMCGIHPYRFLKNGKVSFLKNKRHGHTPICFALVHQQFLIDYPLSRFPYRYITAMIREDFYEKGLAYKKGARTVRPIFTSAHAFLHLEAASIRVKRDAYSYAFPLYWFKTEKLLGLVNDLRHKIKKAPIVKLNPLLFSNLSKKTTQKVSIAGVRIQPHAMRALIDQQVPDAPQLKITEAKKWYRGMHALLKLAKVKRISDF